VHYFSRIADTNKLMNWSPPVKEDSEKQYLSKYTKLEATENTSCLSGLIRFVNDEPEMKQRSFD
jgi:hypothetical protein